MGSGDSTWHGRGSTPDTRVDGRSDFSPKPGEEKADARLKTEELGEMVYQRVAGFDGEELREEGGGK